MHFSDVDNATLEGSRLSSARDSGWSKEALFGLLGILAILIVPCVGLLLKACFRAYASQFLKPKLSIHSGTQKP